MHFEFKAQSYKVFAIKKNYKLILEPEEKKLKLKIFSPEFRDTTPCRTYRTTVML